MTEEIRAEMVANVWRIVVAEGDAVSDGDTLVILESMKMEIPVLSEVAGTVSKLAVAEGDVVQQGDLIAVVELPNVTVIFDESVSQLTARPSCQNAVKCHGQQRAGPARNQTRRASSSVVLHATCGSDAVTGPGTSIAPLHGPPLVLAHTAPHAGILPGCKCPAKALSIDRAATADGLRLGDLQ